MIRRQLTALASSRVVLPAGLGSARRRAEQHPFHALARPVFYGVRTVMAPALERIGVDPVASGMRRHLVSYPYLGEVPCFVADLETLGQHALAGAAARAA